MLVEANLIFRNQFGILFNKSLKSQTKRFKKSIYFVIVITAKSLLKSALISFGEMLFIMVLFCSYIPLVYYLSSLLEIAVPILSMLEPSSIAIS